MQLHMMHPGELKSYALAAAAKADRDGFTATATAMMFLAEVCANEARELLNQTPSSYRENHKAIYSR